MSTVNEAVERALTKKVMAELDLDAMAKEIAPLVRKEVKDGILRAAKQLPWYEIVMDALGERNTDLVSFILDALGISQKPKSKSRSKKLSK